MNEVLAPLFYVFRSDPDDTNAVCKFIVIFISTSMPVFSDVNPTLDLPALLGLSLTEVESTLLFS
jgi:hypothetical protein